MQDTIPRKHEWGLKGRETGKEGDKPAKCITRRPPLCTKHSWCLCSGFCFQTVCNSWYCLSGWREGEEIMCFSLPLVRACPQAATPCTSRTRPALSGHWHRRPQSVGQSHHIPLACLPSAAWRGSQGSCCEGMGPKGPCRISPLSGNEKSQGRNRRGSCSMRPSGWAGGMPCQEPARKVATHLPPTKIKALPP